MFDTAIPSDPFSQSLARIARQIRQAQLSEAAQALAEAEKQAPADPRVPLMAMCLINAAGDLKGAIEMARRALKLAPGWPVAQVELAQLLARTGDTEDAWNAVELARQARAAAPNYVELVLGAINAAYLAFDNPLALQWAEEALERLPNQAGLHFRLHSFAGQLLVTLKRHAQALVHLRQAHEIGPDQITPLLLLLQCARALGDETAARTWADQARALAPEDEQVRYWHAIAHGQTPVTQPGPAIASLFDAYAHKYDQHLLRSLQYQVPERVARTLLALYPERKFNLLDLGCGTGLLGMYLGSIQGDMIGIDLSPKMIEQATRHQAYTRLHTGNMLDALRETPAKRYEVITCLDALEYVGDLTPVIPGALRIVKPGGHFIFTCETAAEDGPDLVLRMSNRYAHKASAVQRMCRAAGFDPVQVEHLPALRMESRQPLPGFLVTAHRPQESSGLDRQRSRLSTAA